MSPVATDGFGAPRRAAERAARARVMPAVAIAVAVPALALAGAYVAQYGFGLYPCEMCWWQRYAHFTALALALAALVAAPRRWPIGLAGVAIGGAALLAAYHAGVEYRWWPGITRCTSAVSFGPGQDPMAAIMAQPLVRCDVAQWEIGGVSLAGFDFLWSLGGLAALVWALRRGRA